MQLWDKFRQENKIVDSTVAVSSQLPSTAVNRRKLFPGGYNPSIITRNGRTFVAYRYHPTKTWQTQLAIAELSQSHEVIENKVIDTIGHSNEDPRLFIHDGRIWISYVHAIGGGPNAMPTCSVRYGRLVEGKSWTIDGQHLVNYKNNGISGVEKNWVPFVYEGAIHFIYQMFPEHTVISVNGSDVVQTHLSKRCRWKWGEMRGGTVPLEYNGQWLRFFHSRLNNEPAPRQFRYYVGALLMNKTPPFDVTAISKRPILRGSEFDALSETEKSSCHHWKANCALPYGAEECGDSFTLSVGVNDALCELVTVSPAYLNL
jgi:predicted GH43/DUF377 family glycosyl hydrolase